MLNRRSMLLYVRVRVRRLKHPYNLLLPLALFAPYQLLLAWGGLLALIPGATGRRLRLGADTLHGVLTQLMREAPQTIACINYSDKTQQLRVVARTIGFLGGEEL